MDATTFYRWEKQAKEGMREALSERPGRNGKASEREIERLRAGAGEEAGDHRRGGGREPRAKKGALKLGSKLRHTAGEKREALRLVRVTQARTGWTVRRILKRLGLPKSRYYDWRQRADKQLLADLFPGARRCPHAILAEEKEAVIEYALEHPKEGYRRLAWQMIDEDVAWLVPPVSIGSCGMRTCCTGGSGVGRRRAASRTGGAERAVAHGPNVPAGERQSGGTSWSPCWTPTAGTWSTGTC